MDGMNWSISATRAGLGLRLGFGLRLGLARGRFASSVATSPVASGHPLGMACAVTMDIYGCIVKDYEPAAW